MTLYPAFKENKCGPRTRTLVMAAGLMLLPLGTQAQDSLFIDTDGDVGLGVSAPERQLHIRGTNAQIRVDRPADSSSFQLVRTSPDGSAVWKSFVFGVNASGVDDGLFFIRDNGTATTGSSPNVRLTIANDGNATFQGNVTSTGFITTSSERYKTEVVAISDASESLKKLRGVHFVWKENSKPSLGFIAEEVAQVFPELVESNIKTGQAEGVNYAALTAVLTEAFKEQQAQLLKHQSQLADLQKELVAYRSLFAAQQAQVSQLQDRLNRIDIRQANVDDPACAATVRFAINDSVPTQLPD